MNTNPNTPNLPHAPIFQTPEPERGPKGFARRMTHYLVVGAIVVLNVIGGAALIAVLIVSLSAIYWFTQRLLDAIGGK